MSKLTSIATYSVFNRLWEDNQINDSSLTFILDTGQLYTHGMFINGAIFGSATTQAVPITIAGSTYTLSLSSHTHSNYLEKNTDIDITGNKITSNNIDVLYYSGGGLYFGDSSTPIYVSGNLNTFRNNTVYDVLDTGNFSVSTTLPTGHVLSNTAYIQYGSSSFQIDYVKRVNTSQSFDYLNSYTQAGTTLLNGKYYGYITLYTDTVFTNPAWAQMRIDISGRTLEYRTSANPNSWINLNTPEVLMNALNVAGLVAAPTSTTINKVWKTDGSGNPGWRDETSYTFSSLKFQLISGTDLMTYNTLVAKTILAGSNISFTHDNGTLTIKAQDTTYGVVSKTSAGLAPQLPNEDTVTKFLRQDGTWATPTYTSDTNTWREIKVNGTQKRSTSITSGDLNFINGSNTTVEWTSDNKLKINSTWTAWKGATDSANGTAGYMPAPTSAQRGQFLRGDGSWVSLNNYSLPTASNDTLGGVKTGSAITDTTGYTAVAIKDGVIYYKDTNTTYTFYNLLFQNSGGTTVDTYKPTTSPTKTLKAGSNVTISASSNVITISSTDTNTWRGILNNLTSDSTTDSLSAALGKALNAKFANYVLKSGDSMSGALSILSQTKTKSYPTELQLVINGPTYNENDTVNLLYCPGIGFHLPGRTWANLIWDGKFKGVSSDFSGYVGFYGSGFYKDGSSDSYILLGGGGHKAVSDFATSGHNHDGRYIRWSNATADTGAMGWGTLTSGNGFNILSHCSSSDGGDMGWCYKGGLIYYQVDGFFYQNEGRYRCIDESSISSQSVNYANSAGNAGSVAWGNVSGKPGSFTPSSHSHSYSDISGGRAYLPENVAHYFRDPNNGSWRGGLFWGSGGSESMSFVTLNSGTRFQFVCGSDIAGWNSSTWSGVNPTLTIRNGEIHAYNCYFVSKRTDSNMDGNGFTVEGISRSMSFAIGSGNVNRGVYDHTAGKWILYWDASSTYLDFGNVYAPNYYVNSDRNKKHNIRNFSEHIRLFTLNDTGKDMYGVVAQEVAPMFREGEEGHMTVNYSSVLAYYVGILENKNKELEGKVSNLEALIEYLKSKIN